MLWFGVLIGDICKLNESMAPIYTIKHRNDVLDWYAIFDWRGRHCDGFMVMCGTRERAQQVLNEILSRHADYEVVSQYGRKVFNAFNAQQAAELALDDMLSLGYDSPIIYEVNKCQSFNAM